MVFPRAGFRSPQRILDNQRAHARRLHLRDIRGMDPLDPYERYSPEKPLTSGAVPDMFSPSQSPEPVLPGLDRSFHQGMAGARVAEVADTLPPGALDQPGVIAEMPPGVRPSVDTAPPGMGAIPSAPPAPATARPLGKGVPMEHINPGFRAPPSAMHQEDGVSIDFIDPGYRGPLESTPLPPDIPTRQDHPDQRAMAAPAVPMRSSMPNIGKRTSAVPDAYRPIGYNLPGMTPVPEEMTPLDIPRTSDGRADAARMTPQDSQKLVRKMAMDRDIDPELAVRMMLVESEGDPQAVGQLAVTRPDGTTERAQGLMQIMPSTGRQPGRGVDELQDGSVEENVRFGLDLLKRNLDDFGQDYVKAVLAYNWGDQRVRRWDGRLNSLPRKGRQLPLVHLAKVFGRDHLHEYDPSWDGETGGRGVVEKIGSKILDTLVPAAGADELPARGHPAARKITVPMEPEAAPAARTSPHPMVRRQTGAAVPGEAPLPVEPPVETAPASEPATGFGSTPLNIYEPPPKPAPIPSATMQTMPAPELGRAYENAYAEMERAHDYYQKYMDHYTQLYNSAMRAGDLESLMHYQQQMIAMEKEAMDILNPYYAQLTQLQGEQAISAMRDGHMGMAEQLLSDFNGYRTRIIPSGTNAYGESMYTLEVEGQTKPAVPASDLYHRIRMLLSKAYREGQQEVSMERHKQQGDLEAKLLELDHKTRKKIEEVHANRAGTTEWLGSSDGKMVLLVYDDYGRATPVHIIDSLGEPGPRNVQGKHPTIYKGYPVRWSVEDNWDNPKGMYGGG